MKFLRLLAIGLPAVGVMYGQVATGRITGRVTDASGAVVPAASVKAINIQTNVETASRSTSDGVFELQNLIPGQYRLDVQMTGFKGYSQGPLELRVGDALTIQVMLQLGSQTESVTVS